MFTGAVVSAVANYIALFAVILLMPFYLEECLGLDPARTGMLLLASQPLVMALAASPSGWLSDRLGSRGLAFAGMLVGVAVATAVFHSAGGQTGTAWPPR